ncbi:hypothetical protein SLUN_02230 [Streptomyces lunaelactis]|uniref:DUF1269 domain-containing family protein n=1 Tax=Streptomyces lunaelactis TaxID=1535768 RepID=A0A2R4SWJ4_9ACTN|nr:DUF6325 family protein [Streptomyces lunaelactis]AVZ71228.1 hypothetical protein SLUN_02230 [Streptomyces lunaelactis]NUK02588.1 hypothetical protein [Streptomyces lunaelactis]NUK06483.1 hypothetical protein [Streptomyces lunaelactis]NUK16644.1 hypothetical protein [Streptomyces lunaelactis]NUK23151.1 hypothetical protein [Streptomyces lunaelactis]
MEVGPVEYVVIAFPGNRFRGEIAPELQNLVASGTVRILDLTFIKKDEDGSVSYVELDALDPTEASVFDDIDGEVGGLFSEEDLELIAEGLVPNSSAAVLVWEDTWAAPISRAIRNAGGELVAHERIPAPVVEQALEAAA